MFKSVFLCVFAAIAALCLLMVPAVQAARIFDVGFSDDMVNTTPSVAAAFAAPPANTKPTAGSTHTIGSTSGYIMVDNATNSGTHHFASLAGFGDGNFAVIATPTLGNATTLMFAPNSANQVATGVIKIKFDLQIDGTSTRADSFRLALNAKNKFGRGSTTISTLYIGLTDGALSVDHNDGAKTNEKTNVSLDTTKSYSIEGILTLDGSNSSIRYKVGDTWLANGNGVTTFAISDLGAGNAFNLALLQNSSLTIGNVAIDNITMDISPIPEPGSLGGVALAGLLVLCRRHHK